MLKNDVLEFSYFFLYINTIFELCVYLEFQCNMNMFLCIPFINHDRSIHDSLSFSSKILGGLLSAVWETKSMIHRAWRWSRLTQH